MRNRSPMTTRARQPCWALLMPTGSPPRPSDSRTLSLVSQWVRSQSDLMIISLLREMKATKLKKKLPPLIYVCGYLRLLAEPMEPTSALAANLWHLADVIQDAAGFPWDNVREWADAMWYYSDCCGKSWHDTQLQQNERNRIVVPLNSCSPTRKPMHRICPW